jgi:hypothetical protein
LIIELNFSTSYIGRAPFNIIAQCLLNLHCIFAVVISAEHGLEVSAGTEKMYRFFIDICKIILWPVWRSLSLSLCFCFFLPLSLSFIAPTLTIRTPMLQDLLKDREEEGTWQNFVAPVHLPLLQL